MNPQSPADTIAWIVGVLIALLMLGGILFATKRRNISDEVFERESRRPSILRTGLQEFQGFLEPEKKAAVEVVKEEQRKHEQQEQGEKR